MVFLKIFSMAHIQTRVTGSCKSGHIHNETIMTEMNRTTKENFKQPLITSKKKKKKVICNIA